MGQYEGSMWRSECGGNPPPYEIPSTNFPTERVKNSHHQYRVFKFFLLLSYLLTKLREGTEKFMRVEYFLAGVKKRAHCSGRAREAVQKQNTTRPITTTVLLVLVVTLFNYGSSADFNLSGPAEQFRTKVTFTYKNKGDEEQAVLSLSAVLIKTCNFNVWFGTV
ncbi:hypothetical protein CBL_02527 [Carabus blaptoides fortunei]